MSTTQGVTPRFRPRRELLALVGAALLVVVAARYRLDRTLCAAWPSKLVGARYAVIFAVAIVLLAIAWRHARHASVVLATHAIALFAAPFLSSDPLMYAAVGRSFSQGNAFDAPLTRAIGWSFLVPLPPAWRQGTTAYGVAWNALASALGRIAGDDLALSLRLHQLVAMLAILVGAAICARALRSKSAFLVVAACPLSIIEATVGAHNDALLVPLVAGALWAWQEERAIVAVLLLASGVAVKASMALYLAPVLLAIVLAQLPTRRARLLAISIFVALGLVSLAMLTLAPQVGTVDALTRMLGSRTDDHCTRSLECLPRVLFRFFAHMPTAAWVTGLVFRVLGAAWLGYTALRASESRAMAVTWLVRGLFVYLLVLHGWAQSWYALPIVPALPFLVEDDRFAPALRLYLVTSVLYYALVLPYSCLTDSIAIGVSDLVEAMITVFPPAYLLLRSRRST